MEQSDLLNLVACIAIIFLFHLFRAEYKSISTGLIKLFASNIMQNVDDISITHPRVCTFIQNHSIISRFYNNLTISYISKERVLYCQALSFFKKKMEWYQLDNFLARADLKKIFLDLGIFRTYLNRNHKAYITTLNSEIRLSFTNFLTFHTI